MESNSEQELQDTDLDTDTVDCIDEPALVSPAEEILLDISIDSNPVEILKQARTALKADDYAGALQRYQWFYDNALRVDKAYYGVKYSFCLDEWAQLGQLFPEATEALVSLKNTTLLEFENAPTRKLFHEYACICKYLTCQYEVLQQFIKIRETPFALSDKLFSYVYKYCEANKIWSKANLEYLGNGKLEYRRCLKEFDQMVQLAQENSTEIADVIISDAANALKQQSLSLLNMLHAIDSSTEYKSLMATIRSGMNRRGCRYIYTAICESLSDNYIEWKK